ncbi:O-antigen ligase family protein [Protaetiibacter larvae]|uniref:O-antigen ligase domain-containing protein n=1 Tax=Protaetiibacter larvae TaxID=2592654 RepID=A0A5C1YBM2_9MICO|nr:hypothetical protein [Protaetiibacter larvae]QEO10257.1 hypothetical protein FLP23_09710 [Protaetiibacter larvae]
MALTTTTGTPPETRPYGSRILGPTTALFALLAVIMFIPIRAYAIPAGLPFELEPYRLLLVLVLVGSAIVLISTPGLRLRRVRFGIPIAIFIGTLVLSIIVNAVPLAREGLLGTAFGGLLNLLFVLSMFFLVNQFLTGERLVMSVLTFLAWSGGFVAAAAVFERATRINVFLRIGDLLPLTLLRDAVDAYRAGGSRSFGSAQHPIALSVMLCMLLPLVVYLARYATRPLNAVSRAILYGGLGLVIVAGIAVAVSRTGVVVLAVMFLATLLLRPLIAVGAVAITLPLLLVGLVVTPKTIETTLLSFLDVDSLIASQYTSAGWGGAGRLADLGPAFAQVAQHPIFGGGYGGRIVVGEDKNGFILDNQVLAILMDAGVIGVIGLAIFLVVPTVVLYRHSMLRRVPRRFRDLAFVIATATVGYAAAMFFYDAFGFMQTLFVLCVLWAVGSWLLTRAPDEAIATEPAVAERLDA